MTKVWVPVVGHKTNALPARQRHTAPGSRILDRSRKRHCSPLPAPGAHSLFDQHLPAGRSRGPYNPRATQADIESSERSGAQKAHPMSSRRSLRNDILCVCHPRRNAARMGAQEHHDFWNGRRRGSASVRARETWSGRVVASREDLERPLLAIPGGCNGVVGSGAGGDDGGEREDIRRKVNGVLRARGRLSKQSD